MIRSALAGVLAAALAVTLAVGPRLARADEPDPRQLFHDGQFAAAAATYEQRWNETARPVDGINAVIAWRAAGRYAHARVVLDKVRQAVPASDAQLVARVLLLDEKLRELTGSLVLDDVDATVLVKIDGEPAERLGDEIVVSVGNRELTVEHEGCTPLHQTVGVIPQERVHVKVVLRCERVAGNLHLTLKGGLRGAAWIDGEKHDIPFRDLDVPLAPGPHRVVVNRRGIDVLDETVEVAPRQTTTRRIRVPFRATRVAGLIGSASHAVATTDGDASLMTGFALGFVLADNDATGFYIGIEAGNAWNDVPAMGSDAFLGMEGVFRVFGPLWQGHLGPLLVALDFDPLAFRFEKSLRGNFLEGTNVAISYMHISAATLTIDLPPMHLQLEAWPAGMSYYNFHDLDASRASYCAGLSLSVGYAPLGM